MTKLEDLIAYIAATNPGLVEGDMPDEERLSRGEMCAELGLDPAEVFDYAALIFGHAFVESGERPNVAAVADADGRHPARAGSSLVCRQIAPLPRPGPYA